MRRRRWLCWSLAAVLIVYAGVVAATARLFVWPPQPEFSRVDAVVVLSGDFGDRMTRALALMADGVAPVLVHAGAPDSDFVRRLCTQDDGPFEVVCLFPDPDSTRAEARAVSDLVRAREWNSIAVVTTNFHATRAGITFRRCVDAEVHVVPTEPQLGRRHQLRNLPGEWMRVGYLWLFQRDC